jgi:hypothetical protein
LFEIDESSTCPLKIIEENLLFVADAVKEIDLSHLHKNFPPWKLKVFFGFYELRRSLIKYH